MHDEVRETVKTIDMSQLKKKDARLLRGYLKIKYVLKHLEDLRMEYRRTFLDALKQDFNEKVKIIDTKNKIVITCRYRGRENQSESYYDEIRQKPYVCVDVDTPRQKFMIKINPLEILKQMNDNGEKR